MKLGDIDGWMIRRVFAPISHWIDYRFRINPWRQAIYILMISGVLAVLDLTVNVMMISWWAVPIGVLCAAMILLCCAVDILRLTKISEQYERRPDIIPADAIYYAIPFNRVMHLGIGLLVFFPVDLITELTVHGKSIPMMIVHGIPRLWFIVAGIGMYFAAVPRPPAKRKKKKVYAPLAAILAGMRNG